MNPRGPLPAPSAGWRDRWLAWRDRLLASPAFQRAAARFPPTRRVARRRAAEVFDLVAGFVYSQVLVACVRLDLFRLLADGPLPVETIAARTGLGRDAATRLLDAAVALRLAERRAGGYGLGVRGAPLVGNAAVAAMVEHHALLYADLADPVALLRGGTPTRLAAYWPYAEAIAEGGAPKGDASQVAAYSALMSASQPLVAEEILAAVPFASHRRLLDVGGGDGTFAIAAARRAPLLEVVTFDLPAVADRARANFAAAGLASRATAVGGSFLSDPLPDSADVVTLVRVLHDHDDARVRTLLAAVRSALPSGGRLVVAEPMAATPGAEAMGDAYFGFYLLAMGRGQPRSAERLTALLVEAGFHRVRRVQTALPLQTGLLIAEADPRGNTHPAVDRDMGRISVNQD